MKIQVGQKWYEPPALSLLLKRLNTFLIKSTASFEVDEIVFNDQVLDK
jgi:hypothetical protein